MKFKRTANVLLAVVLMLSLAGCSGKQQNENDNNSTESTSNAASSAENETPKKQERNMPIRDISSWELVKEMGAGWNLGNTLDATGEGLGAETAWQPVKTTPEAIKFVADSGFKTLRVPVSWGTHLDDDGKIDAEWMARVREVVDYGIDNGLYVILNTHHEEWYMPKAENAEHDKAQLKTVWEQIAEEFKGYDEHLIFEGLNEPRLRGESAEWTGDQKSREIVADYAKTFYETVRASGGNNEKRHLMLTGYAASSMRENLSEVWLPENDDKVIVSVHAYLPYSFALDTKGTDKYDENNSDIELFFYTLDELFLSKKIPVVVGEFGSVDKNNDEERLKCADKYTKTAKEFGVPVIWWDNNAIAGHGEKFGLLNRNTPPSWRFEELVDLIIKNTK